MVGLHIFAMRRPYDHPGRGGEPILRHEFSPPRGYVDSYNHPPREFRHRDGPPNHYPSRSHGYNYDHGRSISPRGYRGSIPPEESRYYGNRYSSERWRSQNIDYKRMQSNYHPSYDRGKPRYPNERDYPNRNYDYDRRHAYDEHPSKYSSRSRAPDSYYKRPVPVTYKDSTHPCKVFVGNIPLDTTVDELKAVFEKCGELVKCDMRKRFAFIEYHKPESASDALNQLNGYILHGEKIKVKPHSDNSNRYREKVPPPRHKPGYAVTVANIEETTSWQDLKDFGRLAGEVSYASIVIKDGKKYGVIEYLAPESAKNALVELQGKQITNNKLEIIEGSIIGKSSVTGANSECEERSNSRELSTNGKRFRDDEMGKDFDDDAQVVDYKSE
ncbi:Pre-mRNA-splicing factor srp2 [Babesia microti strain RI]|uniref:Pre-mRNA-splicing factor srp2 n=1 Tax=Babesia microti (strain RI) TaxID=1133968 RepID=A0A0K3ARI4_BABMR|nr:Pre-mRNA-splicing factor srp2 [Babesia microti strain RI]CTQ41253.1 Pre-mRNA-splicing factor srp2 [Babesia microti strain RI]|eukprot:XP_012649264.1 Pre-mRNA-splicing factor srp2 [Babesia microti strain RI]